MQEGMLSLGILDEVIQQLRVETVKPGEVKVPIWEASVRDSPVWEVISTYTSIPVFPAMPTRLKMVVSEVKYGSDDAGNGTLLCDDCDETTVKLFTIWEHGDPKQEKFWCESCLEFYREEENENAEQVPVSDLGGGGGCC